MRCGEGGDRGYSIRRDAGWGRKDGESVAGRAECVSKRFLCRTQEEQGKEKSGEAVGSGRGRVAVRSGSGEKQ